MSNMGQSPYNDQTRSWTIDQINEAVKTLEERETFYQRMSRRTIRYCRDERVIGACLQIADLTNDYEWDLVGAIMEDFMELLWDDGYVSGLFKRKSAKLF